MTSRLARTLSSLLYVLPPFLCKPSRLFSWWPSDCYIERDTDFSGTIWFDTDFTGLVPVRGRDDICYYTKQFWLGKTHIILDWEIPITEEMVKSGELRRADDYEEVVTI